MTRASTTSSESGVLGRALEELDELVDAETQIRSRQLMRVLDGLLVILSTEQELSVNRLAEGRDRSTGGPDPTQELDRERPRLLAELERLRERLEQGSHSAEAVEDLHNELLQWMTAIKHRVRSVHFP